MDTASLTRRHHRPQSPPLPGSASATSLAVSKQSSPSIAVELLATCPCPMPMFHATAMTSPRSLPSPGGGRRLSCEPVGMRARSESQSTTRHSTAQHSTATHRTAPRSAVQHTTRLSRGHDKGRPEQASKHPSIPSIQARLCLPCLPAAQTGQRGRGRHHRDPG